MKLSPCNFNNRVFPGMSLSFSERGTKTLIKFHVTKKSLRWEFFYFGVNKTYLLWKPGIMAPGHYYLYFFSYLKIEFKVIQVVFQLVPTSTKI